MASQPTSGQVVDGPVKWTLAVGMFVAIGLLFAIAFGVLSQGTDVETGAPPPTDEPTMSATSTSAVNIPPALVGQWIQELSRTRLRLEPDGAATLTTAQGQAFSGRVLAQGGGLVLVFADPPTQLLLEVVDHDTFVLRSPQGEDRFQRVG